MLCVVGMLMYWARDPATWRWIADDTQEEDAASAKPNNDSAPAEEKNGETLISGPNDQQPFERSQAEYQFQAITDKTPNAAEEMPAYWRLMRWSKTESFDDLWERSRKDLYFTHLAEAPEKYRGELIGMKLTLHRFVPHDPEKAKNSADVGQVYEVWGVTKESRTGLYCLVFYDLPPQLPNKPSIHEEATFVGYFLKQLAYEDTMGVKRWAPMLIGRLHWRENLTRTALRRQREGGDFWPWLIVAGAAVVFGVAWKWTRPSVMLNSDALTNPPPDHATIERWLEDGAPEQSTEDGGILAEWEGSADANAELRPVSIPQQPTISPSGDVTS